MKLKYRLEKWEKSLVFQVLWMDERFRSTNELGENRFRSTQGFSVISGEYRVTIGSNWVSLPGVNALNDLEVGVMSFDSNEERDEHYNKIQEALKDWATNWEGWKEEKEVSFDGDGVFEV